eukprot:TRINITY_DN24500_c0_g1_i1.p1 TRINITY_DN24500_c0_g1~~TRINITY_DN24500_c0_g1_i1.p1  ORF type:complete len:314 (+),score=25.77 TRINITY_DN24500_c0_g1_i1:21-962(+)
MNLLCSMVVMFSLLAFCAVIIAEDLWLPKAHQENSIITENNEKERCPGGALWHCAGKGNCSEEYPTCGSEVKGWYPNRARGSFGRKRWWRDAWLRLHGSLKNESLLQPNTGLAFVGDSLTANLRKEAASRELRESFSYIFNDTSPLLLGIAGDTTQNLIWRLLNDELPGSVRPSLIVLLIGTNNVPTEPPVSISQGIVAIAKYLSYLHPGSQVLTIGVLPRYDRGDYPVKVAQCNNLTRLGIEALQSRRHTFLDCSEVFIPFSRVQRLGYYDFDNLHIKQPGYEAMWAECLVPMLQRKTSFAFNVSGATAGAL